jgi:rhomboid protease GluP
MATCRGCGKDLSSFSVGDLSDLCPECRHATKSEPAAEVQRPSFFATVVILGINVGVFAGMMLLTPTDVLPRENLIRWGASYGPLIFQGQWWRLFTPMFIHAGIFHLLVNMWCLWNLGRLAEWQLGRMPFVLVYLASGVGGVLGSLLWHPNIVSAGASGAIFGLAGALISADRLGAIAMPGQELKRYMGSLVPFVFYNLFLGAAISFIDNAAHIGGLVTGLAFGAIVARRRQLARWQS